MNLKNRLEKLEEEYGKEGGVDLIVYITRFGDSEKTAALPDPEKEIAQQRAEGKKIITVEVPYDYVLKKKEGHDHEH